ncbi:MAG: homoserine O-acetyltransferase [Candidatus Omnitrophica bacterium]|nr:homoserine O-acetyltransferase [Candidatus Omnitrophota bacterium]
MPTSNDSLGIVETKQVTLFDAGNPLTLVCGDQLNEVVIAYETYGTLNADASNAIYICHALTGDAHAAGWHEGDKHPGWWDTMIGPGKSFDTNKYFVVSSSCIGSCYGTSGPASIDPETGKPYGLRFPMVTIRDMVEVQKGLVDFLGIKSLLCVAGGSMGGMQVLEWTVSHPECVRSAIPIATTWRHSAQQIAFNEVARQAVIADPAWNQGDYYDSEGPRLGLAGGRMVGHITYLSDKGMEAKFGRRLRGKEKYGYDLSIDFEVESYLKHQGSSFVDRFDANSFLYVTKALDYFDLGERFENMTDAFRNAKCPFLVIAFSSDWLYPPYQNKSIAEFVRRAGGDATFCEISSDYGHDAFLLEYEQQASLITAFLERSQRPVHSHA